MYINNRSNYSPNYTLNADRLQKMVQQLNTRALNSLSSQSASGRTMIQGGLEKITEEKDQKDPLKSKFNINGKAAGGSNSGQQMKDTYSMLEGLKKYAGIISKYEGLAADETKSHEERSFYQHALQGLKEGFQSELDSLSAWNQTKNLTTNNSKEITKEFGLDNVANMTSEEILSAIETAQKELGKFGSMEGASPFMGMDSSLFEILYTKDMKGYDEYGYHEKRDYFDPDNLFGEILSFLRTSPSNLIDTKA